MIFQGYLADLIHNLKKLPGVGTKSARRMAIHLLDKDKEEALALAESIRQTVENYHKCSVCNMLTDTEPCIFCSDENRQSQVICIVEHSQDVFLIEETGVFKGKYFVLGKLLSPLDGIGPDDIYFPKLKNYINREKIREIILALNPSAEGESTMSFLATELENLVEKITRLATGLPFGGDIEYTSSLTLENAFKRRYSVKE
ncbi:MAG: recombination protein RecR [Candidatus Cloacimonetes bacterium]|nr:recombination protein RecR [Candidatus Cloacimonadota bacterium]